VSLLTQIGHPEWIANSAQAYVQMAAELATNHPRLADIRRSLRADVHRSPLCQSRQFATDFTLAVRQVWRQHCASDQHSTGGAVRPGFKTLTE
jgi:predicted O-linked N-acetylglucosamine transferase (SPINDLY family)